MSESPREWWHAPFGHLVRALIVLLRAEKEGRTLTTTDLLIEARIPSSTFYRTIKRALVEGELARIEADPRERAMIVKLTDKGRKLAQCLEEARIEV